MALASGESCRVMATFTAATSSYGASVVPRIFAIGAISGVRWSMAIIFMRPASSARRRMPHNLPALKLPTVCLS